MLIELITQSTVHTERPMVTKHIQQLDSINQADQWLLSRWAVQQCLLSEQGKRGYNVYRVNKVNEATVFTE